MTQNSELRTYQLTEDHLLRRGTLGFPWSGVGEIHQRQSSKEENVSS
ncbi:MAG: hypothetical protein HC862_28960 [Scytonema sp. RU_4_4]|nr:hypothetical protein [Scytonema sp. RU_4_4]